jgi:hypothetical protein
MHVDHRQGLFLRWFCASLIPCRRAAKHLRSSGDGSRNRELGAEATRGGRVTNLQEEPGLPA